MKKKESCKKNTWKKINQAVDALAFVDGVVAEEPAWHLQVNHEEGLIDAYVYSCDEGGFGATIFLDHDSDDGTWGETLEEAQQQVEYLITLY